MTIPRSILTLRTAVKADIPKLRISYVILLHFLQVVVRCWVSQGSIGMKGTRHKMAIFSFDWVARSTFSRAAVEVYKVWSKSLAPWQVRSPFMMRDPNQN
jgi:hypothetical protein